MLFGEYANQRLLLRLPHRQIVFTFPKILRHFFPHEHSLLSEVGRLVYRLMQDAYRAAAAKPVQGAAVIVYASAGDFVRWNPHLHAIFLEGGFDFWSRGLRRGTLTAIGSAQAK